MTGAGHDGVAKAAARRGQAGLTTVEFAIVGAVAFLLLFGCIEIARALFVWNTIGEATRRAVRLGAVCPPGNALIARAALFRNSGDGDSSPVLPGLTTANVRVTYLNQDGVATAEFSEIYYINIAIAGYQHQLVIPFLMPTLTVPPFSTTIPVESLGYVPGAGRICMST